MNTRCFKARMPFIFLYKSIFWGFQGWIFTKVVSRSLMIPSYVKRITLCNSLVLLVWIEWNCYQLSIQVKECVLFSIQIFINSWAFNHLNSEHNMSHFFMPEPREITPLHLSKHPIFVHLLPSVPNCVDER